MSINKPKKLSFKETKALFAGPDEKKNLDASRRQSLDTKKSDLRPGSLGSNVVILINGEELVRVHYAVLVVRWSFVNLLETTARKNMGNSKNGLMKVDLANLTKHGMKMFPEGEDFFEIFSAVFLNYFVPLIHEQFNISKNHETNATTAFDRFQEHDSFHSMLSAMIELELPNDSLTCFKLLIICERLEAKLRFNIFKHMMEQITVENCVKLLKFYIIKVQLQVVPIENSLQAAMISELIKLLIGSVPKSLATIEDLVFLSTSHHKPSVAVQLFQHCTAHFLTQQSGTNGKAFSRADKAEKFICNLKKKLINGQHEKYRSKIFSKFKQSLDVYKTEVFESIRAQSEESEKDLAEATLMHGVILEKFGTGLVCLWCEGDSLHWMTLNRLKKVKQVDWTSGVQKKMNLLTPDAKRRNFSANLNFESRSEGPKHHRSRSHWNLHFLLQKTTQGIISRDDIICIKLNENDPFEASFNICYVRSEATSKLTLRTKSKKSCLIYVSLFKRWFVEQNALVSSPNVVYIPKSPKGKPGKSNMFSEERPSNLSKTILSPKSAIEKLKKLKRTRSDSCSTVSKESNSKRSLTLRTSSELL